MVDELVVGGAVGLTVLGNTLAKRVSEAVGGLFKPWQIQRVADAEAQAEAKRAVILVESQIEVTELQQRAALRWLDEETKNQANIEAITSKAVSHLSEQAAPDRLEDDFLRNFFDKGRLISDEQMQDIWARVLAGEANHPGSFPGRPSMCWLTWIRLAPIVLSTAAGMFGISVVRDSHSSLARKISSCREESDLASLSNCRH